MSYRYDEQTESWVVADDSLSSSEMTTSSQHDDHKHDHDRDHFSPSAPSPPPRSIASSHHSASTSSSIQSASAAASHTSSSRSLPAGTKHGAKANASAHGDRQREWSDDEDFEYVAGDEHHDEPGAGFPIANAAPASTSRWFSPSTYLSVPSGRGPQQPSTSYRGRRDPASDAASPSFSRCFHEVFSCCAAIWHAVKQPFHQNMGLIFCFVASGGLLFGMGLIFAAPGGSVNTEPIVDCKLGELEEGLFLTPSCSNYTEVPAGATCTWSCATGYDVAGGTAKRTCMSNSTWSGKPLRCEKEPEVLACAVPMAPAGASLEPSDACAKVSQDVPAHTECLWVCDGELHSVGGNMQRECREDGTWSGEPVECKVVEDDKGSDEDGNDHDDDVTSPQEPEATTSKSVVTSPQDPETTTSKPKETTKVATEAPVTEHEEQSGGHSDSEASAPVSTTTSANDDGEDGAESDERGGEN